MKKNTIEIIQVSKKIRGKKIIKDLSFSIKAGEVFGFIGPNGAGKTTTIRMIVGLMNITEGDIKICGYSIKTNFNKAIQQIGAIVENPELYPFMTGWQNLKHFANMTPGISTERIKEVVHLVGLERSINQKVSRYSLGMRQRLGIAQALLHKPAVLILDEPTNGLDPAGIKEIRKYIRQIAVNENTTVIISSHLLSEIELMCDRIGIIKNGELLTTQYIQEPLQSNDLETLSVKLEVDSINDTVNLIQANHVTKTEIKDTYIIFDCLKKEIPLILKTLISSNILIYKVETSKTSLEDKFFQLIEGDQIV